MNNDDYNSNEEFFMDESELFAETQVTIIEKELDIILEQLQAKVKEARENLEYCERDEFAANFQIIARFVTAINEVSNLENALDNGEITEDEVVEKIKKINLNVVELSFTDLEDLERNKKQDENEEVFNDGDLDEGTGDNFDF